MSADPFLLILAYACLVLIAVAYCLHEQSATKREARYLQLITRLQNMVAAKDLGSFAALERIQEAREKLDNGQPKKMVQRVDPTGGVM